MTGKEVLFGYDKKGRPAFYMIPSRQNTTDPGPQLQFAVWMLERAIDLMGPGVECVSSHTLSRLSSQFFYFKVP